MFSPVYVFRHETLLCRSAICLICRRSRAIVTSGMADVYQQLEANIVEKSVDAQIGGSDAPVAEGVDHA